MRQFKQAWEVETFPPVGVETNKSKSKEDKDKFNFSTQSIDMKECVAPKLNNAIKRVCLRKHIPLIMSGD